MKSLFGMTPVVGMYKSTSFAAGDITNNSMRLSFKAQEQAAVVAANLKVEIVRQGKNEIAE
jgi:pyruvate/2-oxoglutarate dehydrogenase complex dihydrolipoamide dehydrogenase (E3) component